MWNMFGLVLPNGVIYFSGSGSDPLEKNIEGLRLKFLVNSSTRVTDFYTEQNRQEELSKFEKYIDQNKFYWLMPSEHHWKIDLDLLKEFILQSKNLYLSEISSLKWFTGVIFLEPNIELDEDESFEETEFRLLISFEITPEVVKEHSKDPTTILLLNFNEEENELRNVLLDILKDRFGEQDLQELPNVQL